MTVYVATQNLHKLEEFSSLLAGVPLRSLQGLEGFVMPPETGTTFLDNSVIKARAVFQHTGCVALADDSGMMVDALDGAPGVYSARYVDGSDADRYLAVLDAMTHHTQRSAKFVACLTVVGLPPSLALPPNVFRMDDVVYVHGEVHGRIALNPRGDNGFGYDPIFELPDGRTMAEVSSAEKQSRSHRAIAARHLYPILRDYFS